MELKERLQNVAVVGAAGKMGSGISLLLAQELAFQALENPTSRYVLNLIDISDANLQGLLRYIREQCRKTAEKQINRLRQLYAPRADLVENGEIIDEFVHEVALHIRTGKSLELARDAQVVFEAALEKEELKFELFSELGRICPKSSYFLTNTSSIPLGLIAKTSGVEGRVIGYHFYNPPAVQKLVELITPTVCDEELKEFARALAKPLGKKIVPANDIAGFIGNGHFMRDGLHALAEASRLKGTWGYVQAIHAMDCISRDYLLRPMGIFQLIDYVGIDVFQCILRVMNKHLPGQGLHSDVIDAYLEAGVTGGQTSSGAQKDGFLKYEKNRPAAVFDLEKRTYVPYGEWSTAVQKELGNRPMPELDWKGLQRDGSREARLRAYFGEFKNHRSPGVDLAKRYLLRSKAIGLDLVNSGVASSAEDVNSVLMLGFFHLYGPINAFLD